jgi:agmatine/peptidylarginine deiminase
MFDWIEQVPGATLDDSEVVIPHTVDNFNDTMTKIVYNDTMTNFVYISDKLKEFYPRTYARLTKLFDEMEIEWGEVKGTKDIWIRDYMPIQLSDDRFLVYKYNPDYLKDSGEKYLTDSCAISEGILEHCNRRYCDITLDGGNIVTCAGYRVLTDKVFQENGKRKYNLNFCSYISDILDSRVIFLPWHCDNPDEPNADVYGHADGLVHWVGENRVLMSNHRDSFPEEADEIKRRLEAAGFEVIEILFDVPNPNRDFNWAYINYLEMGNKIIVPTFGIPEDKQALKYIREANPNSIVCGFRMRDIARNGGAIHCITWNIMKWELPFEPEEQNSILPF